MIDLVIIGAGVIGLAIAREASQSGLETIVLEKNNRAGDDTTSRNSGVVHSGIYYPENYLKTSLCVEGNKLLYEYAIEKNIKHNKYGKYIIASCSSEEEKLKNLFQQAKKNNVEIYEADSDTVKDNNPGLIFNKAIFSPNSGVIDVPEYVTALEGDIQHLGGIISFKTSFLNAEREKGLFRINCESDKQFSINSKFLINCSGLNSENSLSGIEGLQKKDIYKNYYAKGHYFKYSGKTPFSNLIYPISGKHSLGIHVGFDLAGGMRFGPDIEFVDKIDYSFDETLKDKFLNSISKYWPEINPDKLHPDYTGIRPKITKPNEPMKDFSIQTKKQHGLERFINLQGIESPGLTSSLAIGKYVMRLLTQGEK
jgi:L-2-hydroxyglutarate oxidase LhgO